MSYIELLDESRGYSITLDSITQTFVYKICPDVDLDQPDSPYGAIFNPNDDAGVALFVYATFPLFRVFPISSTDLFMLFLTEHSARQDKGAWVITLTYSVPPIDEGGGLGGGYIQFGVDIGGETEHVIKSYEVVSADVRTTSSLIPPTINGLIGLTSTKVTGADRIATGMNFNITTVIYPGDWSLALLSTWYSMIATYNNALFQGFAAGEVLLTSASAQGEQFKRIPVTFNFNVKPNLVAQSDPPFPDLTSLGHHLVDYLMKQDVNQNFPIQIPQYRYIHRLYHPSNFALLGI